MPAVCPGAMRVSNFATAERRCAAVSQATAVSMPVRVVVGPRCTRSCGPAGISKVRAVDIFGSPFDTARAQGLKRGTRIMNS